MQLFTSQGIPVPSGRRYQTPGEVHRQADQAEGPRHRAPSHRRLADGESVLIFSRRTSSGGRSATVLAPR